ncbi:hypothetical protein HXX76_000190 [Chlamydomonas incerta]|uniref:Protein kinase domain-containing protein n=1 Tax=Chlamydomonas incerta TaxID=51695 RepID=A0A835WDX0_CHLIN|nr:hypothetical protein HXX76_000190 [Chlamydomonas incerta]|eukprot:KAG2445578.1 hypothetical protein HXX76_000190 [Chlamydomonas incerta]
MREAILGRVASHPHTVQCFASFSGYITEQDITPRSPDQGHELTPVSSAAALMHLDLDIASAAGNTSTSQVVTPTAGGSIRHGPTGVAVAAVAAAGASPAGGIKGGATRVSTASVLLAASAAASPAGTGGGVASADLPPAEASWPRQHSLQEQPTCNNSTRSTHSSQTRSVLERDAADGAAAQHGGSMSASGAGGGGRTSTDADMASHSGHSGGPRARLGRSLGPGAEHGAGAAASDHGAVCTANAGLNTSAGSRSSSLRHSHLLARGAAELARLQHQQHQQPGSHALSQQRGFGAGGCGGGGSLGGPVSSGRGGSSRALRTMTPPPGGAVLMSQSAAGSAGTGGAAVHGGAAAQLAEDAAASAAAAAGAPTSASAFTHLSVTGMAPAAGAADSATGTQSLVASAATGRRRSYSLARGTLGAGATSASGGQASHGALDHRSLSLVGLGSAAHVGQSRTTLTLSDLLYGLNGGDEGGHGGHGGGGGGGAGTYELWQVLAATGALPGRYCTLVVMEMCDQGTLLTKAQQRPFRAVRSAEAAGELLALLRTALEVAQGMCHLHSLDIVHGDLKPSNVLLQSNAASISLNGTAAGSRVLAGLAGGAATAAAAAALAAAERERDARGYTAKVADFGMASKVEGSSPRAVPAASGDDGGDVPILGAAAKERGWGSLAYLAPEVPEHGPNKKSDVWSFGMCLYFMCCGKAPYSNYASLRPAQMLVGIVEGSLTLDWPDDTYRLLRRLAETCCQRDPAARPPFSRIVPALQRLVRHICSHPEPSASASTSALVSGAAGAASGVPSASAAAAGAGRRRPDRPRVTGGGSGAKGAASLSSSGVVDLRQGQWQGHGQQHRQPRSPKAAMNSASGVFSSAFDHGSSSIVNMELHPSPLQLFANCLTLPAAASMMPNAPPLGSAAGLSSIPAFASSGGAAMPALVGMGGAGAAAVVDSGGAARGGDSAGGLAAGSSPATATMASQVGAKGPFQAVSHSMYGRSAAPAAGAAGGATATVPAATAAAAAAAVMGARGEAAAAAAAAAQGPAADCSSSHCAADCSLGGCLDDSSLTYNTTQTFTEAAQVCKTLDGSSYNLLPPSAAPPTAAAPAAGAAAPHLHPHQHLGGHAPNQLAQASSLDPSCASASGAAAHASGAATRSTTPTAASTTGETTSPVVTGPSSVATPADRSTTVSGGSPLSTAPVTIPTGPDLAVHETGAAGMSPQQQQPQQQQQQQQQQARQLRRPQGSAHAAGQQEQAAAAAGRDVTPAARAGRSADVQGLATKLEESEGGAEPAAVSSTHAAASGTEEPEPEAHGQAAALGAVAGAGPAGAAPGAPRDSPAWGGGLGI